MLVSEQLGEVPEDERNNAVDPFVSDGIKLAEKEARSDCFRVQCPINNSCLITNIRQIIERLGQNLQHNVYDCTIMQCLLVYVIEFELRE